MLLTLALLALSVPWGGDLGWAYLADRQYALARDLFTEALRGETPTRSSGWGWPPPTRRSASRTGRSRRSRTLPGACRGARPAAEAGRRVPGQQGPRRAAAVIERLTVNPGPDDVPLLERLLTAYLWKGDYAAPGRGAPQAGGAQPDGLLGRRRAGHRGAEPQPAGRGGDGAGGLRAAAARRSRGAALVAQAYDSLGQGDRAIEHWKVLARIAPADVEARDRLLPGAGRRAARGGDRAARAPARGGSAGWSVAAPAGGALPRERRGPRAIGAQQELAALVRRPRHAGPAGRLLVEQDRGPEAIAAYERAVEVGPERLETALALAQLNEWGNDPRRALALLERVAKARPADRALQERVAALAQGSRGRAGRAVGAGSARRALASGFPLRPAGGGRARRREPPARGDRAPAPARRAEPRRARPRAPARAAPRVEQPGARGHRRLRGARPRGRAARGLARPARRAITSRIGPRMSCASPTGSWPVGRTTGRCATRPPRPPRGSGASRTRCA